jgi:hypothetical protein
MSKKEKETSRTSKRRTQVKELPKQERELSEEEQKKVKGGTPSSLLWVGSNRPNQ